MMSEMTYTDDSFVYSPDDYVESGTTILPLPGYYEVRITSLSRRKDRDTGQPVLRAVKGSDDKRWPVLTLNRVEIVAPQGEEGTFSLFQDINTTPYERKGQGGRKVWAARHMDLLLAIERPTEKLGLEDAIQELETQLRGGATFRAFIGYTASDSAWIKQEKARLEAIGAGRDEINKLYNEARFTTKSFKNPDGSYRTQVQGRLGDTVEAKLVLASFVPAGKDVELGPAKN